MTNEQIKKLIKDSFARFEESFGKSYLGGIYQFIKQENITAYNQGRADALRELLSESDLWISDAVVRDEYGGTGKETAKIITSYIQEKITTLSQKSKSNYEK